VSVGAHGRDAAGNGRVRDRLEVGSAVAVVLGKSGEHGRRLAAGYARAHFVLHRPASVGEEEAMLRARSELGVVRLVVQRLGTVALSERPCDKDGGG
jgi:hypothetical protein